LVSIAKQLTSDAVRLILCTDETIDDKQRGERMKFEWDPRKAAENLRKHDVSFAEAATVFNDELSVTIHDPDHSAEEDRYLIIGWSDRRRLLMVAHTDRQNRVRIISARELTRAERKTYEQET
jgi:uncharacterized protein